MKAKAATWVAALVGTTLVGCLAPGAIDTAGTSLPLGLSDLEDMVVENLSLARPDGASLAMTVFRPKTDEQVPILAAISPYFNSEDRTWVLNAPDRRLAEYFLPHGYAIAQVALRGTGESTGCFSIGGVDEQEDAAAVVDFLGGQEWSNGKVGLIGKSYVGTTPWEAAILKPKHLGAIVPISGITDMYRYMFYNGTTLYPWGGQFLMYYGADEDIGVDPLFPLNLTSVVAERDVVGLARNTLEDFVEEEELLRSLPDHAGCPHYRDLLVAQYRTDVTGDHDAFWDEREYAPRFGEIEVPVFLVHGWQDWNVKPDHIARIWDTLDVPKTAWVGQWNHDYPDINRHVREWSRSDYNETLLAFFDATLKGVENGFFETRGFETQDQLGTWRIEETWPPADGAVARWGFGDGALGPEVAGGGTASFRGTPAAKPGPQNPVGSVVFVSEPLEADLRIAGIPQVDLTVTPMQPGGHIAVVLYNVSADDRWTVLDAGYLDLRHATSRDAGAPVAPGAPMAIRVEMFPQDLVIRAGDRVGLAVAGEFPPEPSTADPFWWLEGWASPGPIYPWPTPTAYEIDMSGSALLLPLAPTDP